MQILSPLLDGSTASGTAGQLLASNGAVAAPSWRTVQTAALPATDGLRVTLVAGTPYPVGDQIAKASLSLTPASDGQASEFDGVGRATVAYATGGASLSASGNVTTAGRWYDVFESYNSGGSFGVRDPGLMSSGGTGRRRLR